MIDSFCIVVVIQWSALINFIYAMTIYTDFTNTVDFFILFASIHNFNFFICTQWAMFYSIPCSSYLQCFISVILPFTFCIIISSSPYNYCRHVMCLSQSISESCDGGGITCVRERCRCIYGRWVVGHRAAFTTVHQPRKRCLYSEPEALWQTQNFVH